MQKDFSQFSRKNVALPPTVSPLYIPDKPFVSVESPSCAVICFIKCSPKAASEHTLPPLNDYDLWKPVLSIVLAATPGLELENTQTRPRGPPRLDYVVDVPEGLGLASSKVLDKVRRHFYDLWHSLTALCSCIRHTGRDSNWKKQAYKLTFYQLVRLSQSSSITQVKRYWTY